MKQNPESVRAIVDRLCELSDRQDRVSVGDMVGAFGARSYGPFLLLPPLVEESPLGGIPGFSTATAAVIAIFAGQMLFGRKHMWVPGWIARRGISSSRARSSVGKLRRVAAFLDRLFHGRFEALTRGAAIQVAAAICLVLCLAIPAAELVPWSGSLPMLAIAAFGLALLVRDGLLMVIACALAIGSIALGMLLLL